MRELCAAALLILLLFILWPSLADKPICFLALEQRGDVTFVNTCATDHWEKGEVK